MKFVGAATFKRGLIIPDSSGDLAMYKNNLTEGIRLRMTIEPLPAKRSEEAFRLFHALVDAYRKENNLSREKVKMDFKLRHGVVYSIEHGLTSKRHGQIVETPDGKFLFVVSTNEMSVNEMYNLIRGTINECLDAQTDIQDIILQWRTFSAGKIVEEI